MLFPANLHGLRILIPRAEIGRELLPEELRRRGAVVDVVTVYRTVKASGLADLRTTLATRRSMPSSSRVRPLFAPLQKNSRRRACRLWEHSDSSSGTGGARGCRVRGIERAFQPDRATIQDLIQAIRAYFSSPKQNT